MKGRRIAPVFAAFAAVLASANAADELAIWPSAEIPPAPAGGAAIAVSDGMARSRVSESKTGWCGALFKFPEGERDLSAFARIDAVVTNLTGEAVDIWLSAKSANGGVANGRRNRRIRLAPYGVGTIRCHIDNTSILDKDAELPGLRQKPGVVGDKNRFDASRVTGCRIYIHQPTHEQEFGVLSVVARGEADKTELLSSDSLLPLLDEYGQPRHADWPGKVKCDADLEKARVEEEAWLAANADPFPDRDKWGGWKDGPQLEATGAFRAEKVDGKWWLVDPDGHLFWSHGVNCVGQFPMTRITGRENMFQPFRDGWNSPFADFSKVEGDKKLFCFTRANIRRKNVPAWRGSWRYADLAHARLHAWGLNTIGDWSGIDVCLARKTPYTVDCTIAHRKIVGNKGYVPDPFSEDFDDKLAGAIGVLRKAGVADDPWCIGFFVNNEMSWGKDDMHLARSVLASPAEQPAKREFLRRLEAKYKTTEALNAAWGTDYASWEAALESTALPDDAKAGDDLAEFHRAVAEEYFRRVAEVVHREAPGRLYLGCRFYYGGSGGGEAVYRAVAKFCDVLSVNIYHTLPVPAHGDEPGFPDCPMLVGEFHFQLRGRGYFNSGNGWTPEERIVAYREYVEHALRDPRFVGAHWFQWADQPLTGRGLDGENYPCGFVDMCDIPHADLVEAARGIAAEMYPLRFGHMH